MRVLVIEDVDRVASFIQTGLKQEGTPSTSSTTASRPASRPAGDYDAVVLDLMLPGRSGFQVLRDIRARKAALPVLILTAKDSLDERVAGLDGGADDYMAKPFALAELSARLRALLRRGAPRETRAARRRPRDGHRPAHGAARPARRIDLKPKEYALLEFLMRNSRPPRHQVAHHRARLGHPLRQHQQRRRSAHQLAAQQDRPRIRRAADPHRPRRRLHADRHAAVKPHAARAAGHRLLHVVFAPLLAGAQARARTTCWRDSSTRDATDAADRADGRPARLPAVRGATRPSIVFDADDAEQAAFVHDATRYYQIYDAETGQLLVQSAWRAAARPALHARPRSARFADDAAHASTSAPTTAGSASRTA